MRIATDIVRMFRVMSLSVTPAPDASGDIMLPSSATVVTLSLAINDPENATPYQIFWDQQPVKASGVDFSSPTALSTQFGPLQRGWTYHVAVTAVAANGQKKELRFRVIIGA
jgi:hypothetical protein